MRNPRMSDPALGPPDGNFARYIEHLTEAQYQAASLSDHALATRATRRGATPGNAPSNSAGNAPAAVPAAAASRTQGPLPDLLVAAAIIVAIALCLSGAFVAGATLAVGALIARSVRRSNRARATRPRAVPNLKTHAKHPLRP